MVLGHEGSGEIIKIGSEVTNVAPGDPVSFEPGYPLVNDEFTKSGKYNLTKVIG